MRTLRRRIALASGGFAALLTAATISVSPANALVYSVTLPQGNSNLGTNCAYEVVAHTSFQAGTVWFYDNGNFFATGWAMPGPFGWFADVQWTPQYQGFHNISARQFTPFSSAQTGAWVTRMGFNTGTSCF